MKVLEMNQMEVLIGGDCETEAVAYALAIVGGVASIGSFFMVAIGVANLLLAADAYHTCMGGESAFS